MPNKRGFITCKDMGVSPLRLLWNYAIGGISRWLPPCTLKNLLLKYALGVRFGPKMNATVNVDVIIDPWFPSIITFEDDVFTGWGARFLTHRIVRKDGKLVIQKGPIRLRHGCFVGGWTLIEGNTEVGEGAVVASLAILSWGKRVPPGAVAKAPGIVARWD